MMDRTQIGRRAFLRRAVSGGATLIALPLLQACQSSTPAASPTTKPAAATSAPPSPAASPGASPAASPAAAAPAVVSSSGQAIIFGLGAPASGPLGPYAPEMQAGAEMALKEVNRQVLGRPLELIFEDTESKADVAAR